MNASTWVRLLHREPRNDMAEVTICTWQVYRKRIRGCFPSAPEPEFISKPEEIVAALNLTVLPGPRREFVVIPEMEKEA